MSVLIGLPDGKMRIFCKGASEIVLKMCDKIIYGHGETVDFPKDREKNVSDVINSFASEALRTFSLLSKMQKKLNQEKIVIPDNGYTLIAIVGIKDQIQVRVASRMLFNFVASRITICIVTSDNIKIAI